MKISANKAWLVSLIALLLLGAGWQSKFDSPTQVVLQVADQSITSSTTLTNSNSLSIPLEANKKYSFRVYLPFNLAGVVSGYKFGFSAPSGLANFSCTPFVYNGGTSVLLSAVPITTPATVITGALATSGNHCGEFIGNIEVGATAGNFILQFAQNTSDASAITLSRGATMVLNEVR